MQAKILFCALSITATLCFTACGGKNAASPSAGNGASASSQEKNTPAADTPEESPSTESAPAQQEKSAANTPDLSVLSGSIDDLEQRISSLAPPTSEGQELREQFLAFMDEIDALDKELEYTEDTLESQYQDGGLEKARYQEQEKQIDALEDRLDRCEDQVERIFGMED